MIITECHVLEELFFSDLPEPVRSLFRGQVALRGPEQLETDHELADRRGP